MNWILVLVITTVPGIGAPTQVETSLRFQDRSSCESAAQSFVRLSTLENTPEPSIKRDYDAICVNTGTGEVFGFGHG